MHICFNDRSRLLLPNFCKQASTTSQKCVRGYYRGHDLDQLQARIANSFYWSRYIASNGIKNVPTFFLRVLGKVPRVTIPSVHFQKCGWRGMYPVPLRLTPRTFASINLRVCKWNVMQLLQTWLYLSSLLIIFSRPCNSSLTTFLILTTLNFRKIYFSYFSKNQWCPTRYSNYGSLVLWIPKASKLHMLLQWLWGASSYCTISS